MSDLNLKQTSPAVASVAARLLKKYGRGRKGSIRNAIAEVSGSALSQAEYNNPKPLKFMGEINHRSLRPLKFMGEINRI